MSDIPTKTLPYEMQIHTRSDVAITNYIYIAINHWELWKNMFQKIQYANHIFVPKRQSAHTQILQFYFVEDIRSINNTNRIRYSWWFSSSDLYLQNSIDHAYNDGYIRGRFGSIAGRHPEPTLSANRLIRRITFISGRSLDNDTSGSIPQHFHIYIYIYCWHSTNHNDRSRIVWSIDRDERRVYYLHRGY